MSQTVEQAVETLYISLEGDDVRQIEAAFANLREAMVSEGEKEVKIEGERLPNNTREGRRMLKSFARKRKISVTF